MKKIFLIFILISFSKNIYSYNLFDTIFYKIEFESNDIQSEKISQINQIKLKSISNIFNRTLTDDKYKELSKYLSEDFINNFIKNIIVENEKIINNKYKSEIKINFDKKKIIDYFRKENIAYVEYYPKKFLLIIDEKNSLNENLFSKKNKFYTFLDKNLEYKNLFMIPNLDINDRFIFKKEDLKNKNLIKIRKFSDKYYINDIVIVLADTNNQQKSISYYLLLLSNGESLEGEFTIERYNLRDFFDNLEINTINFWKNIHRIQTANLNTINCKINYYNMIELREIRKNLDNISTIKNIVIKSLSYRNVEYDISYYGNIKILNQIFNLNKLKIKDQNNNCIIKLI